MYKHKMKQYYFLMAASIKKTKISSCALCTSHLPENEFRKLIIPLFTWAVKHFLPFSTYGAGDRPSPACRISVDGNCIARKAFFMGRGLSAACSLTAIAAYHLEVDQANVLTAFRGAFGSMSVHPFQTQRC